MSNEQRALEFGGHSAVEAFWQLEAPGGPHRVLPDGCMDFLFDLDSGTGRVIGTMSRALLVHLPRGGRYFGLRFRPGRATNFLGASAAELRDSDGDLSELVAGGAELAERVSTASNHVVRSAICTQYLTVARTSGRAEQRVQRVVQLLRSTGGAPSIARLASEVGLSERQLERLFAEHVGVRPKLFARIVRLQATLRLAEARAGTAQRRSQADLAHAAGYADEAHLVREFKALAGGSLRRLRAERDVGFVQA